MDILYFCFCHHIDNVHSSENQIIEPHCCTVTCSFSPSHKHHPNAVNTQKLTKCATENSPNGIHYLLLFEISESE